MSPPATSIIEEQSAAETVGRPEGFWGPQGHVTDPGLILKPELVKPEMRSRIFIKAPLTLGLPYSI